MPLVLLGLVLALGLVHAVFYNPSEPFFNNDETRHVMTAVYFRDLLHDLPLKHPYDYTINHYLQYPALGLLIWPPFFYLVAGAFMAVFGTAFVAAKLLMALFAAMAYAYLFLLVRRTHSVSMAALAVLLFAFSPIVVTFSRQVMLEIPTLALALAATYYCVRYIELQRRRDLFLTALTTALMALTRFDAIYLLPFFIVLLTARQQLSLFRRKDVLLTAAVVVLLVLPFYWITTIEFGWVHSQSIKGGIAPNAPDFFSLERLIFYPAFLPEQFGWCALLPALVGLGTSLRSAQRHAAWPYLAIASATYLTFTTIDEMESRHTIYWIPAFAFFAAQGVMHIAHWLGGRRARLLLSIAVVASTAGLTLAQARPFVQGYAAAARYVLAHAQTSRFCLFDGWLEGNFVYQLRQHDPDRRLWVLRGDKLFYSSLVFPGANYTEFSRNQEDLLATLFRYDPEFIVVEEPGTELPMANLLRASLKSHPDRFRRETVIPVRSNWPLFKNTTLHIYRNLLRNDHPEQHVEFEVLGLRRSFKTVVP
jgi:hypothetical protein